MNRKRKQYQITIAIATIINLAFLLWCCASWYDIVTHNLTDHVYQEWNIWFMLEKILKMRG